MLKTQWINCSVLYALDLGLYAEWRWCCLFLALLVCFETNRGHQCTELVRTLVAIYEFFISSPRGFTIPELNLASTVLICFGFKFHLEFGPSELRSSFCDNAFVHYYNSLEFVLRFTYCNYVWNNCTSKCIKNEITSITE
jgi:hypothetical protein